ncbi:MAG TPA: sulfur carrier protein ThiS [Acidobacteriota bacterium]|nr:sulfur carrier protein ThiS [Acidobacteriota bacterium]
MNTMTLEINGEKREVAPVATVAELLRHLGIVESRLAVEINRKIIRRSEWESTPVVDRDRVEIVRFVGGG